MSLISKRLILILLLASLTGCTATGSKHSVGKVDLEAPDSSMKSLALDHYLAGTIHEQTGDLRNAAVEFQLALHYDPKSIEIPQALSRVYMQLGEKLPARRVLESALNNNPENPELLTAIGELSLQSGDLDASTKYFRRLSGVKPLSRTETLRQLLLLERSGKREEALELAKDYLTRFGTDPIIYERIGLIHIGRRDFEAADTAFKRLIELDPANHRIQYVLGGFCVAREDYAGAEGYFRRAVEIEPGETRYWANLIMVIGREGKDDTLAILLNDAIRLFPDAPEFYDGRAGLRQERGDFEGALSDANKSIELDSTRLAPLLAVGYICHQLQDWEKSRNAYERALEIAPDSPVVLNNYAYMLSVQGIRLEEALQMVEKALAASPATPSYHDTKGWILHRLGRHTEALVSVETSLKGDPENYEIYEHLAAIYDALGRSAEASTAAERSNELKARDRIRP